MATSKKTPTDLLAIFIATAGGVGFSPTWPGTCGSAVGVLIYLAMHATGADGYFLHAIILLLFAGTLAAYRVETLWGHDAQRIVMDEVVGQMIVFSFARGARPSVISVLVGFGLFRLFDAMKPFPLRRFERLPGGFGVMADDVGAGIYALFVLTAAQHFLGI